jgi:DNA-binding CsgD family transcriptional regulator
MQHDRTNPRPELRALLAAIVASPLEVATGFGEERWRAVRRELASIISANAATAECRSAPGVDICAFRDADSALGMAAALLARASALGVPLQVAVHAGEVVVDKRELSGIAALAVLQAAAMANPGEIVLTQPALTMCRSTPADFVPAGDWQPPGHAIALRLYRRTADGFAVEPAIMQLPVGRVSAPLLSRREQEVVLFVARGHSNREIATTLDIAVGTVERHVANILKKLQFRSRTQIARWAVEQGMIEAGEAVP